MPYQDIFKPSDDKIIKVTRTAKQRLNGKWRVTLNDKSSEIISVEQLLGREVPTVGYYLIHCSLVCEFPTGVGKCIKPAAIKQKCDLNKYYVRKTYNVR